MSLAATALIVAGPASAASTQSVSLTPCNSASCSPQSTSFAAGTSPSITTNIVFDHAASAAPQSATLALEPGLLGSVAANLACLSPATPADSPSCEVGSGTLTVHNSGGSNPLAVKAYLAPPTVPGKNIADLSLNAGPLTLNAPVTLVQQADGNVRMVLSVDLSSVNTAGFTTDSISLSLNGTLNGNPFLRLPSSCAPPDPTALTVVYGATAPTTQTTTAAPGQDATPTGCPAGQTYTPALTGSATKDAADNGVRVTTVVTQPGTFAESANKGVTLTVPSGTLSPNLLAAAQEFGKQVGTATATTPLIGSTPLHGIVTLTGSATAPALTITFPAPTAFSFSGAINLGSNSVAFDHVPDVPLTNLTVTLNGGAGALFITSCQTPNGTLTGQFTPWDGAAIVSKSTPFDVIGCPASGGTPPPTVKPPAVNGTSLTGVGKGRAVMKFGLTKGANGKALSSFTVKLPSGLSFIGKGLKTGVSISGSKIKSEKLSHGQLVITLKSAASRIKVKIGSQALKVSKSLQGKVKAHKIKSLTGSVTVKDTGGKSKRLALKFTHVS